MAPSFIKSKMQELKSPLAGEMSGHIFFADTYYGYDDALYAALRIINILRRETDSLSALRTKMPRSINTPELRFQCNDDRKFQVIVDIKEHLIQDGKTFNDTDGVRVMNDSGWWLLRASNTQDVLVARVEGNSLESLETLKQELNHYLALAHVKSPL